MCKAHMCALGRRRRRTRQRRQGPRARASRRPAARLRSPPPPPPTSDSVVNPASRPAGGDRRQSVFAADQNLSHSSESIAVEAHLRRGRTAGAGAVRGEEDRRGTGREIVEMVERGFFLGEKTRETARARARVCPRPRARACERERLCE